METKAGDPGAFAQFDLNRVDSPAFVVDAAKLRANCQVLADIRDAADIKVLAALKAFSMWSVAPMRRTSRAPAASFAVRQGRRFAGGNASQSLANPRVSTRRIVCRRSRTSGSCSNAVGPR